MHLRSRRILAKHDKISKWDSLREETFSKMGMNREEAKEAELKFQGQLVWPWDKDYDEARKEFDPQFDERPIVVAYCETTDDIGWCLDIGKANGLPLACRSGGHSTAGFSVVTGGIVIDMSKFDYIFVDSENRTATVGVGVDFQTLNNQLTPYGLHIPGGECLDVHIGGYFQGGGYGFTSRQYGMHCDNVLSVRAMIYTGDGIRMVTASSTQNPDLLWALCGGTGNNFGVVIDVTYRCHSVGNMWGFMLEWDDLSDIPIALYALQKNYTKTGAPSNFGSQGLLFIPDGKTTPSLILSGIYNGSETEGRAIIEPLMKIGNPTLTAYVNNYAWLNSHIFPDPHLPANSPPGYFPPEIKDSRYIAKQLEIKDWKAIVAYYVDTLPSWNVSNAIFFEYYGGAINAHPQYGNAFIHRDAYMDIYLDSFYYKDSQRQDAIDWLNGYIDILHPMSNGHSYQNYPRRGNTNYRWMYWGEAFWTLLAIKQKYDPFDIFYFPQGIRLPENKDDLVYKNTPEDKRESIFPSASISYNESYQEYLTRQNL